MNSPIIDTPTLRTELVKEQARCHDLLAESRSRGTAGHLDAVIIAEALLEASAAKLSEDLPRMIRAYKALTEIR